MALRIPKILLLACAVINLILGMGAGLGRLGWSMPLPEIIAHHGAIMVGGFLGTLIALEKVIPLKRAWLYIGPLCSGASIVFLGTHQFDLAVSLLILASAWFVMVYFIYLRQQFDMTTLIAMMGAGCWLTGNILLLETRFYPSSFPWWMAFLVLTIVSERLELSKFLPVSRRVKNWLLVILGLFLIGTALPFHGVGIRLTGLSLLLISLWMLRFDVVHITIRKYGQLKFMAVALLSGYMALLLNGVLLMLAPQGFVYYDILVHTFFLGFVFMMVFAHGPVIIPGVLGLSIKPYHPMLYMPVVILWISLLIRIASDIGLLATSFRLISGWISAAAIIIYFLTILMSSIGELKSRAATK